MFGWCSCRCSLTKAGASFRQPASLQQIDRVAPKLQDSRAWFAESSAQVNASPVCDAAASARRGSIHHHLWLMGCWKRNFQCPLRLLHHNIPFSLVAFCAVQMRCARGDALHAERQGRGENVSKMPGSWGASVLGCSVP